MKQILAFLLFASLASAQTPVMKIVMLPDNQYYSEAINGGTQAMNLAQVSYASSISADAIIGVGDNYNCTTNATDQTNVPAWVSALQATGIRWITPPGNHDFENLGTCGFLTSARVLTSWNSTVGAGIGAESSFMGSFAASDYRDAWIDLGIHGVYHWAALSLECCPTNEDLTWAAGVMDANPTYQFIVTTHTYLSNISSTGGIGNGPWACNQMGVSTDYNEGAGIWTGLVQGHDSQVRLVLCGHWNPTSGFAARQTFIGSHGYSVEVNYFDAQAFTNGGNGFLRVLTFNDDNTVDVVTFSPVTSGSMTDYANQFTMMLDPPGSAKVSLSGTQVTSGTSVLQ